MNGRSFRFRALGEKLLLAPHPTDNHSHLVEVYLSLHSGAGIYSICMHLKFLSHDSGVEQGNVVRAMDAFNGISQKLTAGNTLNDQHRILHNWLVRETSRQDKIHDDCCSGFTFPIW